MHDTHALRAAFARSLSAMYGTEVPAYNTLVEVSTAVNADHLAAHPDTAQRLGSIDRVTAERHGAIRVGTAKELAQVAQIFAALGMEPVGFYDLRGSEATSLPIVSTAFRPVGRDALALNPFRVFTSVLVTEDRRYFDPDLTEELDAFLASRTLFGDDVLALAARAEAEGGLSEADAEDFLRGATACFELADDPVDRDWYARLSAISGVAADIGGVPTTHINHLTPRVLDIDDLYARMTARGITMIDEVQGPPLWDGPDVLLRQTSFKALAERRRFRERDGSIVEGALSVRFGEVEQRGIALTRTGRDLYDAMIADADARSVGATPGERADVLRAVWRERLPADEQGLADAGLAHFTYAPAPSVRPATPRAPCPSSSPAAG
nr:VOC family protein [Propioniciclava coleopterorum]